MWHFAQGAIDEQGAPCSVRFPTPAMLPRYEVRENEPYDHAEDCRKLAATMKDPKHKKQLEEMANAWMFVANERAQMSRKIQGEIHYSHTVASGDKKLMRQRSHKA
jgi:hypothetical protein